MTTPDTSVSAGTPAASSRALLHLMSRYGIVVAFFAICIVLSVMNEYFLTVGNLSNILLQASINGILAIGMTFVILAGGIDLSVGSVLALAGMVSAGLVTGDTAHGAWVGVLGGVVAGMVCGAINGGITTGLQVPSFVVTLAMMSAARGATQIWNDGAPISQLSADFLFLGEGRIYGVPVPVLIFFALFIAGWLILRYTRFGRYVYAVGGNEKSAKTSGISTRTVLLGVYTLCGLCAGLAGAVLTARTTSALTQSGMGYELDAIAAVVIGGTSLSGGVGGLTGTLFGALIIAVINNGLDLLGVSSYYQQVIKGVVIVAAVLLDTLSRKTSR